jgi:hypothetical protein
MKHYVTVIQGTYVYSIYTSLNIHNHLQVKETIIVKLDKVFTSLRIIQICHVNNARMTQWGMDRHTDVLCGETPQDLPTSTTYRTIARVLSTTGEHKTDHLQGHDSHGNIKPKLTLHKYGVDVLCDSNGPEQNPRHKHNNGRTGSIRREADSRLGDRPLPSEGT